MTGRRNTDFGRGGFGAYVPIFCETCGARLNRTTEQTGQYDPESGAEWLRLIGTCPNFNTGGQHTEDWVYDKWRSHKGKPTELFTRAESIEFGWPELHNRLPPVSQPKPFPWWTVKDIVIYFLAGVGAVYFFASIITLIGRP